jgi:hypothetical protein
MSGELGLFDSRVEFDAGDRLFQLLLSVAFNARSNICLGVSDFRSMIAKLDHPQRT